MRKKLDKNFLKASVTIFVVALFLLTMVPANASIQKTSSASEQHLNAINDNSNEPLDDNFWRYIPHSGLYYTPVPLMQMILKQPPRSIKVINWDDKPFPHTTLMYLSRGVGLLPKYPTFFMLMGGSGHSFTEVKFYSDGELYATLRMFGFILPVFYQEKGFHHLKFVPVGFESDTLELDVQIGSNGFVENILPYLT